MFDPWVGKIPLEKGQATHSSILNSPRGQKELDMTERLSFSYEDNLLQSSCLKKIHGQRRLEGYSPKGHKRVRHD